MNHGAIIDVLGYLARGQYEMARAFDLLIGELIDGGRAPILEMTIYPGADGSAVTFTIGSLNMDQTISGKAVGDTVTIKAGPAKDAKGKVISGPADFSFAVDNPAVLGLELNPADVAVNTGQAACRVTVLDVADDAHLTITLARPGKDALTSTCHFPSISPETLAAATDFDISVDPSGNGGGGGGGGDVPVPGPGPSPDIPIPDPNAPAVDPNAPPLSQGQASRSVRGGGK